MNEQVIAWLLEDNNPAIKYRTMTEIAEIIDINDTSEKNKEVYNSIWKDKKVIKMLSKQDENGLWNNNEWGVHTPLRYLTAFAEYGLQKDKRLDNYVDELVIAMQSALKSGALYGCASPLTLRALVMMGYGERNDVKEIINSFAKAQLYDGGFNCKRLLDKKPERKSCYKAALNSLLLYAECKRKNILPDNSGKLIEYFLNRDIFYSTDKSFSFKEGKAGWRYMDNFFPVEPMRIGLPLIVSALSILGAGNHSALTEAWDLLKDKEDESGKLQLEGTLSKQPCNFGKVGQVNKWVTFYAVLAEKYRNRK